MDAHAYVTECFSELCGSPHEGYHLTRPMNRAEKGLLSRMCGVMKLACVLTGDLLRTRAIFQEEERVDIPQQLHVCLNCGAVLGEGEQEEFHGCHGASRMVLWLVESQCRWDDEVSDFEYFPIV